MTWLGHETAAAMGRAELGREALMANLPGIAAPFGEFYSALWSQPYLPAEALELCRLRLAQLHVCEVEWNRQQVVLPADRREQLRRWSGESLYSEGEKACLEFTEVYAMDTQSITDAQADAVKAHFGDEGLVVLIEALGILDGMTRLSLLWGLSGDSK